jgi:multidrug efflux pump subunit AcrB
MKPPGEPAHGFTNAIVRTLLYSNLPIILIVLSAALGISALLLTPREEDPQIIVPMADVYVSAPGYSAARVEQLVATPLENLLAQIDGVEHVYSMSRPNEAIITVRFHVGQDRERSLVKISKKIDENGDIVPPGVAGWTVKPVEIDDVPIVTLTLSARPGSPADAYTLRRVADELVQRVQALPDISRASVFGGQRRLCTIYLRPDRMTARQVWPEDIRRAVRGASASVLAGDFAAGDRVYRVQAGAGLADAAELRELVVRVFDGKPVMLKDVADVVDGPEEPETYVRHTWGASAGFADEAHAGAASVIGSAPPVDTGHTGATAVTIALSKKRGTNAVAVSRDIIAAATRLVPLVAPHDVELVVTRNAGLNANERVNDLIEAMAVALMLAIVVLTLGLGWRESLIVALAVPVVFGLTLTVNLLAGLTINRVTLFALILSLGLLVDDPIVDVENIARHFGLRRRAAKSIVIEAVAEIRPPLISATLAVIASFLPLMFITGMMGPYMRPMALNVPVTMVMSMVVAFTITPWLAYHVLRRRWKSQPPAETSQPPRDPHADDQLHKTPLYRAFRPVLAPLLKHRALSWGLLALMLAAMAGAAMLAMSRKVPLKMLPYGNKDELALVLDLDEGATLERTDACARELETYLRAVPEVTDFTTYVGLSAPMDFNGMVRHYYLRRGPNVAEIQVNLVGRKERRDQTHAIALRLRDDLTRLAHAHGAAIKIVEAPPGPPVLSTVVAEVYGDVDQPYHTVLGAARIVQDRLLREPGVRDIDTMIEAPWTRLTFVVDHEKAALAGVGGEEVAAVMRAAVEGSQVALLEQGDERLPLAVQMRLPRELRSSPRDLDLLHVRAADGSMVALGELGEWRDQLVDQTRYHKDQKRVMYVLAEAAGRAPAEIVMDVQADQRKSAGAGWVDAAEPRKVSDRTYLAPGGGIAWAVPAGAEVRFAGEGEWQLTLEVFRDMGLAFVAALVAIYILLAAQTRSFAIPVVVMMAIPLTIIGILPGFWLLNQLSGGTVGVYANPVYFTATAMIGMIALAGIVTRSSIIIVDFIHLSLARGRSLMDAIIESCVVRLRPILLTASVAMFSALPIATDPIFSGLAWALVFGLLASTVFTLLVIPVVYWLLYRNVPGHGLSAAQQD